MIDPGKLSHLQGALVWLPSTIVLYAGSSALHRRLDISPLTKSEIYLHPLPLWTAGRVRLIDNQRVVDQFVQLRRKVGGSGKESVDHVRGTHDDLANSIAGVLWLLSPVYQPTVTVGPVIMTQRPTDVFGNNLPNTDAAFARVSAGYGGNDLIFARPEPGGGADRFSFAGRGC